MELRHTINWSGKYNNVINGTDYNNWKYLSDRYNNKPLTRFDLILKSLQDGYIKTSTSINKVLRQDSLRLPSGQWFTLHNNMPPLSAFLSALHKCCKTHTAYTYLCLHILSEFCQLSLSLLSKMTIREYNEDIFYVQSIPKWLKIVLERQKEMAVQSGLTDDDPLLFVMRWSDIKKTSLRMRCVRSTDEEIMDSLYLFKIRHGYSVFHYSKMFCLFAGLKPGGILQVLPPDYTGTKFQFENPKSSRTIHYRLVAIYEYINTGKKINSFGYIIWGNQGLYLVHTPEGLLWCPYYLLSEPTVRNREKDINMKLDLHKMGYYPLEFYINIKDHKTLRTHSIIPRKLTEKDLVHAHSI